MNRTKILAAVGLLICTVAYVLIPKIASADPMSTLPTYTSTVQRVEHDSVTVDTTRCLYVLLSTAADGGYLTAADGGLPADLSYICSSEGGTACLKEAGRPADCTRTFKIFDKTSTAPIAFPRSTLNVAAKVYGIASADGTQVNCCPVIGVVTRSR